LYEKKKNWAQVPVSKHFQKIIKNIRKIIFEVTFCIKKFKFSSRRKKFKK